MNNSHNNKNTYVPANVSDILGLLPPPVKVDPPPYRGNMVYDQKTGGVINIIKDPDTFNYIKSATRRVGQQSILRHQTPNSGKLI
jgi:hypothetical protein